MPQIPLVLIDSDDRARNETGAILNSFGGKVSILAATADLHLALKIIQGDRPQVVILQVKEIEQGVRDVGHLVSTFPHATVFVTATEKNPDWILRLVRAGAGEYLTRPVVGQELAEALQKVARMHALKRVQNSETGSVITVYNPSAGMGTTTVAVNLAARLASKGKEVALVDLNLFSGDVAAFLDLAPRYTLANVIAKSGQIDASFLRSVMVQHGAGLQVLNGPVDLEDAERIAPQLVHEVIAVLQTIFAYIVIDTGGQLSECNLSTFGCSDRILFTTVLDLPALRNAKRYLAAMSNGGFGPDKVKLLINRHLTKDDIKIADAESILNRKAYLAVPNAYADAKASINKGEPLVRCCPRSPVTRAVDELTAKLLAETGAHGRGTSGGG